MAPHNNTLEPTCLTGKHFAKMKSKMLTSKARGSAWRWAAQSTPPRRNQP
jgi:hypothetical protein